MSKRFVLIALAALLVPGVALAATQEVPTVRLTGETQIAAPPAAVWARLTNGQSLVKWCPEWKNAANAKVQIARVGDVLDYADAWGNGGRSVVTYLVKDKELRMANEPSDGSYVCQSKLTLEPKDGGTLVRYVESYTDESAAADRKATAAKTETEMTATLKALKALAEKK